MGAFEEFINGLDFELPEGQLPIVTEEPAEEEKSSKRKVVAQKIVTEVWVYTDTEGKSFGNQTIQNLTVIGEVEYDVLMAMIAKRKMQNKRNK